MMFSVYVSFSYVPKDTTVRPRVTHGPRKYMFFLGPKLFQIHGFPNVGHSFTPQLHGYELGPIIKKVTRFLSYTVFQNTQCNSGPYCIFILKCATILPWNVSKNSFLKLRVQS